MTGLRVPDLPDGSDVLTAALLYAAAGWYVLPVDRGTKHPGSLLGKGWQAKTTRAADQIAGWFAGTAHGLALHVGRSGAVAFDVDNPAVAPEVLIRAVRATGAPYQATRADSNGRGHYLFAAEPGSVGNSLRGLEGGWGEIRGLNGIIVVAPTPHAKASEGGLYRWERVGVLPAMPDDLAASTRPPSGGADPASWGELRDWLDSLPGGDPLTMVERVNIAMPAQGRYDRMRDASMELVGYGVRGYSGVRERLTELGRNYIAAVGGERPGGERTAQSEFVRAVAGALHNVSDTPIPRIELLTLGEPERGEPDSEPAPSDLTRWTFSPAQIMQRPRPAPLVSGLLYRNTLAWLIGKPGSFKSFVALDLAAAVADEVQRKWLGRAVHGGPVLYVVAEGAGGMVLRLQAWTSRRGPMSDRVRIFDRAIQARDAVRWPLLVELARQVGPALIVLDTQARVSVGVNENSNTEIGELINRIDELRQATTACVLVVHHIGRHGEDARGASALDGAQDTELKIARVGGPKSLRARLTTDKQKDGADDIVIDLALESVDLGVDELTGEPLSSLVVLPEVVLDPFPVEAWREGVNENQVMILSILREQFSEQGGTRAEVAAVLRERGQRGGAQYRRSSFYYSWNALAKKRLIARVTGTQRFVIADEEDQGGIDV